LFFLKPFSFSQVFNPFQVYVFFVVTSCAKSKPFNPDHLAEVFINFLMLKFPFLLFDIVPFGAPLSLIKFVKLLVSSPVIPTILFFFNHSSKFLRDL